MALVDFKAATVSPDGDATGTANSTNWRTLMKTPIPVNSGGELVMDFSAQRALLTDTTVKNVNGKPNVSEDFGLGHDASDEGLWFELSPVLDPGELLQQLLGHLLPAAHGR